MTRILRVVWLTTLWLVLWRDISLANVASGVALAVVVDTALALERGGPPAGHRVRPLQLARFLVYFAWKLVEANVYLAREIVTPRNRIQTGIIAVSMADCSPFIVTAVANAVSLTPGTLTLEVRPDPHPVLYVHVLHLHDIERARDSVRTFTRLANAAFAQPRRLAAEQDQR